MFCSVSNTTDGVTFKYDELERNIENWSHLEIGLAGLSQLELCHLGYVIQLLWASVFSNIKLLWESLPHRLVARIYERTHDEGLARDRTHSCLNKW